MSVVLFLASVLALFVSLALFGAATTAFHEILAAVTGLAACVLFGSACIVDAVNSVEARLKKPEKGPAERLVERANKEEAPT